MKTLILYATKYGSTKHCASLLSDMLPGTIAVHQINEHVALSQFDRIIVGSPIRMGRVNNKIKNFCEKNKTFLLTKDVSLFLCCSFAEHAQNYFDTNFDRALLKHCTLKSCFGGILDPARLRGFDRFFIKAAAKSHNLSSGGILTENIDKFVQLLGSELLQK